MKTLMGLAMLAATLVFPAASAEPISIELVGADGAVVAADEAFFAGLPRIEEEVRFETSQGPAGGVFEGFELHAVLDRAGLLAEGEGNPSLRQAAVATGADGYEILYSVGEMAPDFGARRILIATEMDGEALPADRSPRIVVPGDRRGARNLYDVVRITVR